MEGTWGRRVFGTVTKGSDVTEFRLEYQLDRNHYLFGVRLASNTQLEAQPRLYGWILDGMVEELQKTINEGRLETLNDTPPQQKHSLE